jgi:hypothetical protein
MVNSRSYRCALSAVLCSTGGQKRFCDLAFRYCGPSAVAQISLPMSGSGQIGRDVKNQLASGVPEPSVLSSGPGRLRETLVKFFEASILLARRTFSKTKDYGSVRPRQGCTAPAAPARALGRVRDRTEQLAKLAAARRLASCGFKDSA